MIDIYYVEDDETISGSVQAYLSRRGCQVTIFSTEAGAGGACPAASGTGAGGLESAGWKR